MHSGSSVPGRRENIDTVEYPLGSPADLEDTVAKNSRFEAEIKYMHDTWGDALRQDPSYNPNLSLVSGGFTLASVAVAGSRMTRSCCRRVTG